MFKLRQSPNQTAIHLRNRTANISLLLVNLQELTLDSVLELLQIRSANGTAHGYRYLSTFLYQYSFVNRSIDCSVILRFISKNARHQCCYAV